MCTCMHVIISTLLHHVHMCYIVCSPADESSSSSSLSASSAAAGGDVMLAVSQKQLSSISKTLSDQMSQLLVRVTTCRLLLNVCECVPCVLGFTFNSR